MPQPAIRSAPAAGRSRQLARQEHAKIRDGVSCLKKPGLPRRTRAGHFRNSESPPASDRAPGCDNPLPACRNERHRYLGEHRGFWRCRGWPCHWRQLGNPGQSAPCWLIHGFWLWQRTGAARRVPLAAAAGCVLWLDLNPASAIPPSGRASTTSALGRARCRPFSRGWCRHRLCWMGHLRPRKPGGAQPAPCFFFSAGLGGGVAAATLPATLLVAVPAAEPAPGGDGLAAAGGDACSAGCCRGSCCP